MLKERKLKVERRKSHEKLKVKGEKVKSGKAKS